MEIAIPKFETRFMAELGNLIYPGNFHPVGVLASTKRMFERALADASPKTVAPGGGLWLVVGGSGGFGSGARIALGVDLGVDVVSVSFHAPAKPGHESPIKALGSAAWLRDKALDKHLRELGRKVLSYNLDAFDPATRAEVIAGIRRDFGGRKLDGVIWALAAPRGLDPRSGEPVPSSLKAYGVPEEMLSFTLRTESAPPRVEMISLPLGTPEEVVRTQYVMGGGIVSTWVEALVAADLAGPGFTVLPVSYRGTKRVAPIYRNGLLGLAKADLEFHTAALDKMLRRVCGGRAIAVEGPAVVTEASAAIPGAALYVALLLDVLGARYEDPLDSMRRMVRDHFAPGKSPKVDMHGLLRMDDVEQSIDVLDALDERYMRYSHGMALDDVVYDRFMRAYAEPRGFAVAGVDYDAPFSVEEMSTYG
jgi:enoyl-[acyl-carrier protein] reductase/trans-2-enoyl-CoA reductase (NAD+)